KAAYLYKLAADQGYAPAQYNLAVEYEEGIYDNTATTRTGSALTPAQVAAGITQSTTILGASGNPGAGIELSNLRVTFSIKKATKNTPNTLWARIYNMAPSTKPRRRDGCCGEPLPEIVRARGGDAGARRRDLHCGATAVSQKIAWVLD